MFSFLLWLFLGLSAAHAQNTTCATRPPGDSSNACASTAFVHGGFQPTLPSYTANQPLIGNGTNIPIQGTRSGNTVAFPTVDSTPVSGNCAVFDSFGGLTNTPCTPSGSGTVGAGLTGQVATYPANGTSVVGATATVSTMASLRALTGGEYPFVWLQGYYNYADGGEGFFVWNGTSAATDDGGTIIQPNAGGTGRWLRQVYNNDANVRWWGAHCNWTSGSGGTDDSALIQTAISWAQSVGGASIEFPRGALCALASGLFITTNNVILTGQAGGSGLHTSGTIRCSANLIATAGMFSMVTVYQPSFGAGTQVGVGNGVRSMCLFGQGLAQVGLTVQSQRNDIFSDIYTEDTTNYGLYIGVAPLSNGGNPLSEACDTQMNSFLNISINELAQSGTSGIFEEGYVGTTFGCNPSFNTWTNTDIMVSGQPGIVQDGVDNEQFINTRIFSSVTGPSISSTFTGAAAGPGTPFYTNAVLFQHLTANVKPQINANSNSMQFLSLDNSNSTPAPFCAVGSAHANWTYLSGTAGSC